LKEITFWFGNPHVCGFEKILNKMGHLFGDEIMREETAGSKSTNRRTVRASIPKDEERFQCDKLY